MYGEIEGYLLKILILDDFVFSKDFRMYISLPREFAYELLCK
jgi:hypothetical protein